MRASPILFVLAGLVTGEAYAQERCQGDTSASQLTSYLVSAETAFSSRELEAFTQTTDTIRAEIPCVRDELDAQLVARVHRIEGIRQFVDREILKSSQAFAAARSVEPGYRFPTTLVPDGSILQAQYLAIDLGSNVPVEVTAPKNERLVMNAALTLQRATVWPTLVQLVDGEKVTYTGYLAPDEPMPKYDPLQEGAPLPFPYDDAKLSLKRPLTYTATASGAGAVVLYGVALSHRAAWVRASDVHELDVHRHRANSFTAASGVAAVLALGMGTGAVFSGSF